MGELRDSGKIRALGLEYFYDAIQQYDLVRVPFIRRVGILDENDINLDPSVVQLFSYAEPDYRMIYVMERLEHLDEADAAFFTEHVYGMDWKDDKTRAEVLEWVATSYGETLAEDIRNCAVITANMRLTCHGIYTVTT